MRNAIFRSPKIPHAVAGAIAIGLALAVGGCSDETAGDDAEVIQPPSKVKLHRVDTGALTMWQFAEGVAQARQKEFLQFELPGSVTFIGEDENGVTLREGSRVVGPQPGSRFGQLIARLDRRDNNARVAHADAEVSAALRRIEAAEAAVAQANSEFERQRQLQEQGVSVAVEFEAAEGQFRAASAQLREAEASARSISAQAQEAKLGLERTSLFAPFDGVISVMNLREGDYSPGPNPDSRDTAREANSAVVIIDDSEFEVTLQIPPYEAPLFEEGQRALVASSSFEIAEAVRSGDTTTVLEGSVWSVSPSISLQNRAVTVKLRVSGEDGIVFDGSYVTAWIATASSDSALVAPYKALSTTGLASSTYVYNADTNTVERREVTLGLLGLDSAEIKVGLRPGDEIVIEGQHLLRNGSKVEPITEIVAASERTQP